MAIKTKRHPVVGGLLDTLNYDDAKDNAKAEGYLGDVTGAYDGLTPPDLAPISLEDFLYEGDIAGLEGPRNVTRGPDLNYQDVNMTTADLARMGPSAMEGISADPRLREYQLQSLAALQEIVDGGGLNASDKAALNRINNENAQADRGRREAILQNMHMRGMAGSGDELLAQLQSSSAATDRQAQQGMDLAAQMEARKLAAIQSLGAQGGSLRDQDFSEAARIAAAQDAINQYNTSATNTNNQFNANTLNQGAQFNAGNQLDVSRYNSDKAYDASKFDINNQMDVAKTNAGIAQGNRDARQGVSNANTQTKNQQTTYNAQLPQQNFDNKMNIASGKSGAAGAGVNYYGNQAATKNAAKGNMLGAGIGLGAAAMMASDKRSKEDVHNASDDEIDEFLACLNPKEFNYKDPEAHGKGRRTGVMAQDVEKSKLGKMIISEDEDGVKGLDKDKTMSLMLAALGSIAKRMDK